MAILEPFAARNACDGRRKVWAHVWVDHDGQGHRACRQDAIRTTEKKIFNFFCFCKKISTKKDFVPIPAELYEHVDNVVDVTVVRFEVVAMGIHRNVHQFRTIEQMVENTFREPVAEKKINENVDVRLTMDPISLPGTVTYVVEVDDLSRSKK